MSEFSKRPRTRERRPRSHSAKARLTPPGPDVDVQLITKERVKSAKAIKSKHISSSGMFVQPPPAAKQHGKARFKSMYSSDFDGTFVPPAEIRPTSPTRRNNPHPGKQFMVWRVPTREIGAVPYEEGLELPPEYITGQPDFDAIDELGANLGGLRLPPAQASSSDYGAYLHKNPTFRNVQQRDPRTKPVSKEDTQNKENSKKRTNFKVPNVNLQRELLGRILANDPEKRYALEEWLETANPEEQHTVLKMFKSAEEAQVRETIDQVMQPEAARAVQGWLKGADVKEKDVAVRLFSSLGSRPSRPLRRSSSEAGVLNRPPSRKPFPPTPRSSVQEGVGQGSIPPNLRTRRLSAPPSRQKPWPAGIWHHKPVRDPPPQVYHRGSLFGATKQDASHFNIHPEWQDYHAGDVVH